MTNIVCAVCGDPAALRYWIPGELRRFEQPGIPVCGTCGQRKMRDYALSLAADARERGIRCETCAYWSERSTTIRRCLAHGGARTASDGCSHWRDR